MASSIKDVSKLAGVSISTVSRVINNAPNVHPDIRLKVQKAIDKLNYEPNRMAQSLSGNPFHAIGIAAARSSNMEYTSLVLRSIGTALDNKNYDMILNYSHNERNEVERCLSMAKGKAVQGLILLGSKTHDALAAKLYENKIPFVVIGRATDERIAEKVYTVDTDNIGDSKIAVGYLFSLGHKRIACLHSPMNYVAAQDRVDGFIKAHKEEGILIDHALIVDGGYGIDDAYEAALKLLKRQDRPTAVFATDDVKALGVYKAAQNLGLSIPGDISVVGHNNYESSQMAYPALTTIDVPIYDLGTSSTNILFKIIGGEPTPTKTILPTRFIVRRSCRELTSH